MRIGPWYDITYKPKPFCINPPPPPPPFLFFWVECNLRACMLENMFMMLKFYMPSPHTNLIKDH
jgi:hypothetical protein